MTVLRRLIRMIHPSIFIHTSNHLFASLLLRGEQQTCCCSLQLLGLAWIILETVYWSTGWVVGSGEREREVQTIPFNTDTQARAEHRARQSCRLINIPQVQSTQPVIQCNGSGGSTPHYTMVNRHILINFK